MFPRGDWRCAECGCFAGERIVAWKTGIPRARRIVNQYMLDYYDCIRPVL